MKHVLIPSVAAVLLCCASAAFGQQTPNRVTTATAQSRRAHEEATSFEQHMTLGELSPTPEMWFYEQQMREYRKPKNSVRRRAEFEADQRQQRLAAMDWYGFSNSRPTASPTPYTGPYSPGWASNSTVPYQWSGVARQVIVAPMRPVATRGAYGMW